ncbi:serine hydrolase FSH [Immersiella caudata]|uniref:Serine hydrolase FSH n=1 Tax=Immersiella caudata TaxID=314043 RepID=A0AA39U205_9PEZI|nr:serine hydrolase FSH [Immersiella caudata]
MAPVDPNLGSPRILCLHGGGVNGKVFRLQCRALLSGGLANHFRLVFPNGPFPCDAHPAIAPVYGDYGPFYRWLRWEEFHEKLDARHTAIEVLDHLCTQMDADEGTGEWVGVLGFSQGAKLAASLLWEQEHIKGPVPLLRADVRFRFGVFMAGSAPLVLFDPHGTLGPPPKHIDTAETIGMQFTDWPINNMGNHAISSPTLHVHGRQDPGIQGHRKLWEYYVKPGSAKLFEWDGDHRIPLKTTDVMPVVNEIIAMAKKSGLLM